MVSGNHGFELSHFLFLIHKYLATTREGKKYFAQIVLHYQLFPFLWDSVYTCLLNVLIFLLWQGQDYFLAYMGKCNQK